MVLRLVLTHAALVVVGLVVCFGLGAAGRGALSAWPRSRLHGELLGALALAWGTLIVVLALFAPGVPLILTFPLPAWAALVGVATSAAWGPKGKRAAWLVAAALVLLPVAGVAAAVPLALQSAPAITEAEPLSPDARRAILASFRGKNPRGIPPGEVRTVTLGASEAAALLSWLADAGAHGRARLALEQGAFRGEASLPLPGQRAWLNGLLAAELAFEDGQFAVSVRELRVGALSVPAGLVDVAVRATLAALQQNRDVGTIVSALSRLELSPERVLVSYGRLEAERGMFARLVWGAEGQEAVRDEVSAYVDALVDAMAASPRGDARFEAALQRAFARAGTSSEGRHEALIALGIVLGHRGLGRFVGLRLEGTRGDLVDRLRAGTTLRGRDDWARHFAVSGALTALADTAPSDAVGILKEQLDADGGSGFSFGDLLADRSGTRFAERILGPEGEALAARVAERVEGSALMPEAAGLPEGIPEQEFLARYGGLAGERSKALLSDIEARLAALPL